VNICIAVPRSAPGEYVLGAFRQRSGHPCRNATTGSIFIARRAGKQQAPMAMAISNNETTLKVSGPSK
jgi:hypothetical protein